MRSRQNNNNQRREKPSFQKAGSKPRINKSRAKEDNETRPRSYGGESRFEGRKPDRNFKNSERFEGSKPKRNINENERSEGAKPKRDFKDRFEGGRPNRNPKENDRFQGEKPKRDFTGNDRFEGEKPKKSFKKSERFEKNEKPYSKRQRNIVSKDSVSTPPVYDLSKVKSISKKGEKPGEKLIRLNKYISNAGVCSRRDADLLILGGEIKVNGQAVTELGYKVNPRDEIRYGNKILKRERMVYVLLNKPKDFLTTTEDPGDRKTVMALVESACEERIYPVGRLDRNTTGLLLLTNDGELAEKLSHPSKGVKKLYQVDLDKPITDDDFEKVLKGLDLEDGIATVDEMAVVSPDKKTLGVEIHIGKNRIVRRIFEHLGYQVVKLDRVMYAGLSKKDLSRGQWRYLTEKEVIKLKYMS